MPDMIKIAIDAMGGDDAPQAMIDGALWALKSNQHIFLYLVGDAEQINDILKKNDYDQSRIEVIHTDEIITNEE